MKPVCCDKMKTRTESAILILEIKMERIFETNYSFSLWKQCGL